MSSACASNLFSNPQCGQLTQTLYLSPVILSKRQALASDGITSTLKLPELNLDFGISKHTQSKLVLHLSQIWFPREYIGIFQPPKTIYTIIPDYSFLHTIDPLFLQIEACQICLIPSVYWVAAQVVFIYVACDGVAIVLYLTTGDLASIFSTELPHGFQVFQHIFPQHIHDLPQIFLEYRCIQFRFSALLPCMQKLFAIPTKIDSKMTDDPSRCIQLWCLLKEKIRWL